MGIIFAPLLHLSHKGREKEEELSKKGGNNREGTLPKMESD
jgi:hypothetical protein